MKNTRLLSAITAMSLFLAVQVSATTLFTDDFENRAIGGLDMNYVGGPNAAENGTGNNVWFGPPNNPNGMVTDVDDGVTPHSGNHMVRGQFVAGADWDANRANMAFRYNDGKAFTGNIQFDFWLYDKLGAGGSLMTDYAAIEYYSSTTVNLVDSDYPIGGTGSLSTKAGIACGQRLSLGCYTQVDSVNGDYLTNLNYYQARIVGTNATGTGDCTCIGTSGWWNLTTAPRTVGWHHFRIAVGPALANMTNVVCFFVDDMTNPALVHNSTTSCGYNFINLNEKTGAQTGYYDDISFSKIDSKTNTGNVGDLVSVDNAIVTVIGNCLPTDTMYVESADRTNAMRIHYSGLSALNLVSGSKITTMGTVKVTDSGEKYIEAYGPESVGSASVPEAVGMNNRDAAFTTASGMFIKTWGKVSNVTSNSFTITDGSNAPIKVLCGSMDKPADGSMVYLSGAMSKDESGPVLYMRDVRSDWNNAE
ncbi:MAG TPA: hypothetical protein VHV83_03615 [Armatimonadota bacterium]|nr:hypothetical protein [Armatimonadota bacterium]